MNVHARLLLGLAILAVGWVQPAAADQAVPVGVARIDITPEYPIRLTGYASRKTESEGVAQRLWAKALAIGGDEGDGPAVLMMVENCGVPGSLTAKVAGRLEAKAGVKPERFVVCSTHTHSGPMLRGFAPAIFTDALPPEHQAHIDRYGRELADRMEQVALAALAARKPGRLAWAQGDVGFAMNRRPIDKTDRCPGLGVNRRGLVDHSLPVLCATDAQGKVLAIVVGYACHGTTLGGDFNRIHGDWPGMAQQYIEADHPGATALVCLGCAGDANPEPRGKLEMTALHGRAVADEVNRLLGGKLTPLCPALAARRIPLQLPFEKPPSREEFQRRLSASKNPKATSLEKALGVQAAAWLAQLDRGRTLPAGIDYSVTTWTLGDDLAMVFLPGEVVVDYALRLKREMDAARLWVTAYANDVPCYIPSRRVLAEGGYEPDFSMIYYDRPGRLAPVVEDRIIDAARSLLPEGFDAARAQPLSRRLKALPFKIAWECYVEGNWEIFVMNADGLAATNLTRTPAEHEHYPQVSPDGTKLCFTVDSGEGRDAVRSLWVMDIDGKNRRKIADQAREPFWGPDSKTIGYLPQEFPKFNVIDYYTKGMVFYNLESGKTEPHVNSAALHHLYNPSYAPNGKWIASTVHAGMGFSHAILLIEAHGRRIIDLKIPGCRPCISPDGRHIAWGADDHELAVAPLDLDSEQPSVGAWSLHIKDERNKIYHIDWSPDSRFVAFSRGPEGDGDLSKPGTFQAACEIVGVYAKGWNICVAAAQRSGVVDLNEATGADFAQLTGNGASNKEPAWFRANRPAKE
jgi:hypothetical protein